MEVSDVVNISVDFVTQARRRHPIASGFCRVCCGTRKEDPSAKLGKSSLGTAIIGLVLLMKLLKSRIHDPRPRTLKSLKVVARILSFGRGTDGSTGQETSRACRVLALDRV